MIDQSNGRWIDGCLAGIAYRDRTTGHHHILLPASPQDKRGTRLHQTPSLALRACKNGDRARNVAVQRSRMTPLIRAHRTTSRSQPRVMVSTQTVIPGRSSKHRFSRLASSRSLLQLTNCNRACHVVLVRRSPECFRRWIGARRSLSRSTLAV
jgi:hypothetical protein